MHPSLLPKYRGSYPLWWALRRREKAAGLTLYVLDDGIDTGPVVGQWATDILKDDTFPTLYERVAGLVPLAMEALNVALRTNALAAAKPQPPSDEPAFRTPRLGPRVVFRIWWSIRRLRGGTRQEPAAISELTPADRDHELRRIRAAFAGYESSGHALRWSTSRHGERYVAEERKAWLLAHVAPEMTLVDLGCGDGNVGMALAGAFGDSVDYVGVDLLDERLAVAKERLRAATFIQGSADHLPIPDASVDLVTAMVLLSSITVPALRSAIIAEADRILKPGGRLLIYDIRYPSPRNRSVSPVRPADVLSVLPGWKAEIETLGLLPPLARRRLSGNRVLYRLLSSVPILRSHVALTLSKPSTEAK
jgi:SAM-dependent methyltransferase